MPCMKPKDGIFWYSLKRLKRSGVERKYFAKHDVSALHLLSQYGWDRLKSKSSKDAHQ